MSNLLWMLSSPDTTLVCEPTENGKRKPKDASSDEPERKRTKLTRGSRPANFTRHPVFWAEDGSVILQFGNTRLKLHRTRLALHSKWFQELLDKKDVMSDKGVPLGIPWTVENGVDLFRLDGTGVSVKDFAALLTTLEDGLKYRYTNPPFDVIVSLVRAASFFQFETILKFATTYLEEVFSDDVEEVIEQPLPIANAAVVILLARIYSLPQLLKRAFYELARAPAVEGGLVLRNDFMNALDKDDVLLLLNLQKHLMASWVRILALSYHKPSCPSSPACYKAHTVVVSSADVQDYRCDPIKGLNALKSFDWKGQGFCPSCVEYRLNWLDEQKEELWKDIEDWLNLSANTDSD